MTLDKIKYFFRHAIANVDPRQWNAPLNHLSDDEIVDFLWNKSGESVAWRCLEACRRAVLGDLPPTVREVCASV